MKTTHQLHYIGGLNHIRTEQYIEHALRTANKVESDFRPGNVDIQLLRPLCRPENDEITIEVNEENLETIIRDETDQLCAKASIFEGGPTYHEPTAEPEYALHEEESCQESYESLDQITEQQSSHDIRRTLKHAYSDHAYASLLLFGYYANQGKEKGCPPQAMVSFSADYHAPLPPPGNTISIHTKPLATYTERGREHQDVSTTLHRDENCIAEATYTACTAPDIIGPVTFN